MSKISLQMYSMRSAMKDTKEVAETLKKVSAIGYKSVQISVPPFMDVKELKMMLDDNGLKADSVLAKVGEIQGRIDAIAQEGKVLGTDIARTTSIPFEQRNTEQGYHEFCRSMNRDAQLLVENGFRKCFYHFHSFEFIKFPAVRGIDIMLQEFDPRYLFFQPDLFWLTGAGTEPSQSLKMFEGVAEYIHVKDYQIVGTTEVIENVPRAYAPVGAGNMNWSGILKTAREIGIQNYVVEQDDFQKGENIFECVATSFNNLVAYGVNP